MRLHIARLEDVGIDGSNDLLELREDLGIPATALGDGRDGQPGLASGIRERAGLRPALVGNDRDLDGRQIAVSVRHIVP